MLSPGAMTEHTIYKIPYQDKFIIYQPLNKFAFIGNQTIADLIEDVFHGKKVDKKKYKEVFAFLDSYGFFKENREKIQDKDSGVYKPTVVVLCLTSACNLRCTYCFAGAGDTKHNELPFETGKKAIDIVYANAKEEHTNKYVVSFHGGGEPSLPFKKMQQLTAYAKGKDKNCSVELTSNGLWDEDKTSWIISNIDNLTLSFDGIKEVQDHQRPLANGEGSFDTVMKNILRLDKASLPYGIRLTATQDSITRLKESISFLCSNTRCRTFQVEPAFNTGRAFNNNQSIEDSGLFVKHFLEAYDVALENNRYLYYSGARPWLKTSAFCGAHEKALVVTPEGLLSSCYEISGSTHPLSEVFHFGKISDSGELDIDFSKRSAFHNKITERKVFCKECFCYSHCAGDCPAKTILPGSFDNTIFSDRCEANREITKELLIRYLLENNGIYKT